ncbi:hypothetical protein KC349_g3217 [Hortaea werneckii]|nr:hypothetical protein KC349_g3217 [Hortaea werneckii]
METFSVENLQASIIVAFDTIGSGRGPSAWSMIGSMARNVEQMQLSVESAVDEEREGSRRWNNSLTDADVHRRLPCEGALWEAGNSVRTPFFGVAARSSATNQDPGIAIPQSERQSTADEEIQVMGGFAYSIEAMENLNAITTLFLRHPVDFQDPKEVQVWLLRFKELDLRLVKWRLFLPAQWSEASSPDINGALKFSKRLQQCKHHAQMSTSTPAYAEATDRRHRNDLPRSNEEAARQDDGQAANIFGAAPTTSSAELWPASLMASPSYLPHVPAGTNGPTLGQQAAYPPILEASSQSHDPVLPDANAENNLWFDESFEQ